MTCSIPVEVAENSMVIVAQTDVVIDSGGGGGGGGNYQEKSVSYTPTESQQTDAVTPGAGYDALSKVNVTVDAVSPYYIGTEIDRRSSSDMTVSGKSVLVPAGYYSILAAKSVADGTEGTPTATKGAVSNHSVSVTPSVVNSAGYIAGGTKTGTPVTVSASELVSGDKSITSNGDNIDVTNYATVSVNVSSGASPVVASGSFTGSGTYQQTVALGAKVPVKNFAFIAEIATNTLANDANYKIVHYTYLYDGSGGFVKQGSYYYPVTGKDYTVGDSTTKTLLGFSGEATFMRNTNAFDGYRVPVTGTDHQYRKGTDTINFRIDTGNGNYKFVSGETYNWKLIYFGSNYDNESITYSGF